MLYLPPNNLTLIPGKMKVRSTRRRLVQTPIPINCKPGFCSCAAHQFGHHVLLHDDIGIVSYYDPNMIKKGYVKGYAQHMFSRYRTLAPEPVFASGTSFPNIPHATETVDGAQKAGAMYILRKGVARIERLTSQRPEKYQFFGSRWLMSQGKLIIAVRIYTQLAPCFK